MQRGSKTHLLSKPRACFVALSLLAIGAAFAEESAVSIDVRPGVTMQALYMHHSDAPPKAVAALMAGGGGLNLNAQGSTNSNNFLIRSRELFYSAGYDVVAVANPSDHRSLPPSYRASAEHVADLKAVVEYFKNQSKLPIWMVGTSRGTTSTAAAAAHFGNDLLAGVVLTSTVTTGKQGGSVLDEKLGDIRIPVLVVRSENDACKATPPYGADAIIKALTNAPVKKLITETGGESEGDPCEALAYHGFYKIEAQTVHAITDWMDKPTP